MDPPVRDHLRERRRTAQAAPPRRLAARQPRQFRRTTARKGGPHRRRRPGEGRWTAPYVPPATADRLLLEPVPVLFERDGGRHGVPRLVAVTGFVSARPLPLRCAGCELTGSSRDRAERVRVRHLEAALLTHR